MEVEYHSKSFFYNLNIDKVHIDTVSGFTEKSFEMVPGTDRLKCHIGGIDVETQWFGNVTLLSYIPMVATGISAKNVTIDFELEAVSSADNIHWKLADKSSFHFGSIKIDMKNKFLQKVVDLSSGLISRMVNMEMPQLSKFIDGKVQALNKNVVSEGPMTFAVPITQHLSINLTMTQAPDLSTPDLVKVFFNGLILDNGKVTQTVSGIQMPPRLQHSSSEQFWLHENMVDSLLDAVANEVFPLSLKNKVIADTLKQLFPEIAATYGAEADASLSLTVQTGEGRAVAFDKVNGVVLGDKNDVITTIEVICSNHTTMSETAFTLQTNLQAKLNLTIKSFVVFPKVKEVFVSNTEVKADNIGLYAHNFDQLFTSILKKYAQNLNTQYADGYQLANIDPVVGMLSGLLQNFIVTPYFEEGFMFVGFQMYADMPTLIQ